MDSEEKPTFKHTEIGMIPEDWNIKEFSEVLIEKTRNGLYKPKNFHGKGTKMINMGELFAYDKIADADMELVELTDSEKERFLVKNGDLLFARRSLVAAGAGKCSLVVGNVERTFESSIIRARPDPKKANSEYLFYFFASTVGKHLLDSILRHVAVAGITGSDLMNLKIPLPSLQEQHGVAETLTALDAKITLNQQMNRTLEAIGQAVFKRWFVDFEFPNEEGKPYKSSGGELVYNENLGKEIPKEWKVGKIGDVLTTALGGTPDRTNGEYWDGDIPWINSGKVNEFRIIEPSEYITKKGLENSATRLLPKRTTVLAITGATLGQVSLLEIDSCANQSVVGVLKSEEIPSEYIYFWIKHSILNIIAWQTGGAQQHINKENVNNSPLLIPNAGILLDYFKITKPLFDKIALSCFESLNLSKTCSLLLPKLVSGKIRVPVPKDNMETL